MVAILKMYFFGGHLENLFFASSPKAKSQLTRNLVGSIRVTCRSIIAKSFRSKIQDGRFGRHLENLIFASSPEPKSQLTRNLVGSIGVTCRSKIAKIVPIENPRWSPWQPSWKSIFRFYSWTERPTDFKLGRKYWGDVDLKQLLSLRWVTRGPCASCFSSQQ